MAKRFKLRICRAIATTLQSCRSKHPSDLPQDPVPSFSRLSQVNAKHPDRRHSPSGGGSSENAKALDRDITVASFAERFKWEKEEKWHVVANVCQESTPRRKMYNSSASCGDDSEDDDLTFANPPPPRPPAAEKKKRRAKRSKRNVPSRLRESTSSGDSGWFSCECGGGHEETETLFSSSLTLSTDSSSEFNHHAPLNPIGKTQNSSTAPLQYKRKLPKPAKRRVLNPAPDDEIPARLSMFMKLTPCIVDGKIKESFAIVKRSENPYEDFKNSMIDMIVEKQMFEHKDLEQLLQCFLSLNSRHYHGIIIQAFYEIWDAIFPADASKVSAAGRRVSGDFNSRFGSL
ncbi:transcription repressor OFP7-like [Henckelia pumila]|uniref:transcription repressor OFP7-like n=1 Tax=Henckelia pumila TaxID=405737 RepID=UPI003C6E8E23